MTALSRDRNTPRREGADLELPVKAGLRFFAGALVCVDAAGLARPGATTAGLRGIGCARTALAPVSTDGGASIAVETGVFRWANSAGPEALTQAHIGDLCYVVDDQTVARSSGAGTRSPAGTVVDVDDLGVWVHLGYRPIIDGAGALAAAANLSDVANAATARANLGTNKIYLTTRIPTVLADTVVRLVAPAAGQLTAIRTVLNGAFQIGDATVTAAIDGVPVTGGVVTIAQAGSAAGDIDLAQPSGARSVTAGQLITLTVGGTATLAGGVAVPVDVLLELTV